MLKKTVSLLIVVIMVLSLGAGCSKDSTPAVQPQEPAAGENTPQDEKTDAPGAGADDDILYWNLGTEPETFDPTLNTSGIGGHLINNMFEGLMRDVGDATLEPACAESYEVSDDGLTYTFHLRQGLTWSDGEALTAKDFEYAWKRACSPDDPSPYSFIMAPYIKGGEAYLKGEGTRDDMAVKAMDDLTLQVELNYPVAYFPSLTCFYVYLPVREDIVTTYGDGWEKNPETCVVNGPFKLEEYQIGSHMMLVKNDKYWDSSAVKLQRIKAFLIGEATTAFSAYEAGEIAVLSSNSIPADMIPKLRAEDPNFETLQQIGTGFMYFNVDKEPVNDLRVRKAMSIAIDRLKLCEQVLKGGQLPATGIVPDSLYFSDGTCFRELDEDGRPVPEYGIDPNKANVEQAQALLAEAGYPNGQGFPKLEYIYSTGENEKKIAEALQSMWKDNLNIDVELRSMEFSVMSGQQKAGDFTISGGGWGGDYADPMTMLDLFVSDSGNNNCQWRWNEQPELAPHDTMLNPENKEFDEVIAAAKRATGTERDGLLKKAEDIIMDNMLIMPTYYYSTIQIVDQSVVEGVKRATMQQWLFKYAELVK